MQPESPIAALHKTNPNCYFYRLVTNSSTDFKLGLLQFSAEIDFASSDRTIVWDHADHAKHTAADCSNAADCSHADCSQMLGLFYQFPETVKRSHPAGRDVCSALWVTAARWQALGRKTCNFRDDQPPTTNTRW